jgi:nucleoside-diphosphate-sugar epimerase
MDTTDLICVAGAGGFIGGSLIAALRQAGHTRIRGVDRKPFDDWYQLPDVENIQLDLQGMVTINQLVTIVEDIADVKLKRSYDLSAPKGVRGRNSNNDRINKVLGWAPKIALREGLEQTYAWRYDEIVSRRSSKLD